MTVLAGAPVVLDPYDYAFQQDPYPTYAWLREHEPLHHSGPLDLWALSRHEDVERALRDEVTYSSAMGVSLDKSAWGPHAHQVMSFLAMDPPQQTRLRSLVSRGFTSRRVAQLAPRVEELTTQHLDRCLEAGSFDLIGDFAGLLPMDVISELMGVPTADRRELRRLADLVVHREEGVHDVPPAGAEAALTLVGYYADMVTQRRRRPTEDLTSALVRADDGGDRMRDDEIVAFLFLMVLAGNETTTKLLGHAVFHLTRHPDQLAEVFGGAPEQNDVAALDARVDPWVEETLRHDASSQILARHLRADVELHGRVAPAGSKMLLLLGSANRDECVFTDPDRYDVRRPREEVARLVSFGGGRHFCLGASLARLESRIALRELVRRVRTVEVDHDACRRVHSVNVRGFASVPVRVQVR